jgi:hypothetical protein
MGAKWCALGVVISVVMLTTLAAATDLPVGPSSGVPIQGYGLHDKGCLEWTDMCVSCLRPQTGSDYSCSNIGIACQPEKIRGVRRAPEKAK